MLQSLAGKLNRLNDVAQIGEHDRDRAAAADRLPQLPRRACAAATTCCRSRSSATYDTSVGDAVGRLHVEGRRGRHRSRRRDGRGAARPERARVRVRRCASRALPSSRSRSPSCRCATARASPARSSSRSSASNQFDEDDVRLLEVLAGQASVALENARLYEQQRREAEGAKALLAFADELLARAARSTRSSTLDRVRRPRSLFETERASLWLGDACVAHVGRAARRRFVGARSTRATASEGRVVLDVQRARRRPRAAARVVRATSVRSRCRRRASTDSSSRPPRSRTRCSTRAASWRRPSRRTRCSAAASR